MEDSRTIVIGTADNPSYRIPVMEPGIVIQAERVRRGWSQEDLAKRIGISQPAVKKIESGETKKSKWLAKIAQILEIPLAKLDQSLTATGTEEKPHAGEKLVTRANSELHIFPAGDLLGDLDLPVHAIVRGGTRGAQVLENEPFTRTKRIRRLFGNKSAYGVLVIGDSMAREFRENDIAYVDPHLHPRKDDPCVFQGIRDDGTVEAMLKYLERSPDASETVYYVYQSNPEKRFTLKKAEWQRVHVVVGKESGR
jgi:transcriptional regulator with XRE-family HTH domain